MNHQTSSLLEICGQAPFIASASIDGKIQSLLVEHLRHKRGGCDKMPASTDEITTLIERSVASLDLYADLSEFGPNIEGITLFSYGCKPTVLISKTLTEASNDNRLRSTLGHEYGHVILHNPVFQRLAHARLGLEAYQVSIEGGFQRSRQPDHYESQAWKAAGALLMPIGYLKEVVRVTRAQFETFSPISFDSDEGNQVVSAVATAFEVSVPFARVRLLKSKLLATEAVPALF